MSSKGALLEVNGLTVSFRAIGGSQDKLVKAVDNVSFEIGRGEVLGLVGESGCGKTTLGRSVAALQKIDSGEVLLEGCNLQSMSQTQLRVFRRRMQMVFQNPYSSLNPRMTILDILSEPLHFCKGLPWRECAGALSEVMKQVGLEPGNVRKFPHEFSGGQRQRIAIARALCAGPSLVIADEPVSSLDVSVQAQILSLLAGLRDSMGLTMLFISHDLSVVKYISHRVAVMYRGSIVEVGGVEDIFEFPAHPYTRTLIDAVPVPDPAHKSFLSESVADLEDGEEVGGGCLFRSRCPEAFCKCVQSRPVLSTFPGGKSHQAACWRTENH